MNNEIVEQIKEHGHRIEVLEARDPLPTGTALQLLSELRNSVDCLKKSIDQFQVDLTTIHNRLSVHDEAINGLAAKSMDDTAKGIEIKSAFRERSIKSVAAIMLVALVCTMIFFQPALAEVAMFTFIGYGSCVFLFGVETLNYLKKS
jgi:uncharacterized coiled-coil protein SlyX